MSEPLIDRLREALADGPTGVTPDMLEACIHEVAEARRLAGVVAQLQEKAERMHRRAQAAEAGVGITIEQCRREGVSLGRTLANAGYQQLLERAEAAEEALAQLQQERDSLRLERDATESNRLRGNAELIQRAEAAEGALAHLREQVREAFMAGDGAYIRHDGEWIFTEYTHDAPAREEAFAAYTAALASRGTPRQEEKNEDQEVGS